MYLVLGPAGTALVDAGTGLDTAAVLANIAGVVAPERISHLFLTHAHADHAGGAAGLAGRLPGLRVVASAPVADILATGDARRASVDVGRSAGTYPAHYAYPACLVTDRVDDGDPVEAGGVAFTAVATPGHATGHLCYVATIAGRHILFSGDHLFAGGQIALQNTWDCDVPAHVASLRRLADLRVDRLLHGHLGIALNRGHRHVAHALATLDGGLLPPNIV